MLKYNDKKRTPSRETDEVRNGDTRWKANFQFRASTTLTPPPAPGRGGKLTSSALKLSGSGQKTLLVL